MATFCGLDGRLAHCRRRRSRQRLPRHPFLAQLPDLRIRNPTRPPRGNRAVSHDSGSTPQRPTSRPSEVTSDGTAFRGRPGRVVGHHPRGFPIPGKHHVGSRRAQARELRRLPDPSRVRGHSALDAGGLRCGREPQPDHLGRQRHHAVTGLRTRGAARSVRRARTTPSLTNRTSVISPSWFVLLRRTVMSMPSPSVVSTTSAQHSALTSLRRIPAMNSSPAITASRRPRSRATSSDSTPRPRRRGRWPQGRSTCHEHARSPYHPSRRKALSKTSGAPRRNPVSTACRERSPRPRCVSPNRMRTGQQRMLCPRRQSVDAAAQKERALTTRAAAHPRAMHPSLKPGTMPQTTWSGNRDHRRHLRDPRPSNRRRIADSQPGTGRPAWH